MKPWQNPPVRTTHMTDAATGRQFTIADYRGSQNLPKRPAVLACDYCCTDSTRLSYRLARGFGVEIFPGHHYVCESAHWGSCASCEPFVEARDVAGLVRQVHSVKSEMVKLPPPVMRLLHSIVFACFEDLPVVIWNAGDEFPVRRVA